MIQLYTGDGKGKTTAVIGLAVRAAGRNQRVIFAQFLKSGITGELYPLQSLGIDIIRSTLDLGFTFNMDEKTAALCCEQQAYILGEVKAKTSSGVIDLVVLDEVLDALSTGMLDEALLRGFIEKIAEDNAALELALTGRSAPPWLAEKADYASEIRKIRHPFDRGIGARDGIER